MHVIERSAGPPDRTSRSKEFSRILTIFPLSFDNDESVDLTWSVAGTPGDATEQNDASPFVEYSGSLTVGPLLPYAPLCRVFLSAHNDCTARANDLHTLLCLVFCTGSEL